MRTAEHERAPILRQQVVVRLPARETLALLDPGLGIVKLGGITDGQTTGGGLVPLDNLSGGSAPTNGTPTSGTSLPTSGLPVSIPSL
ncbi:MAG TPA: hypothetical protein VGL23_05290 [Chloroflexota bacterium]|jgi:hypothetical protein